MEAAHPTFQLPLRATRAEGWGMGAADSCCGPKMYGHAFVGMSLGGQRVLHDADVVVTWWSNDGLMVAYGGHMVGT